MSDKGEYPPPVDPFTSPPVPHYDPTWEPPADPQPQPTPAYQFPPPPQQYAPPPPDPYPHTPLPPPQPQPMMWAPQQPPPKSWYQRGGVVTALLAAGLVVCIGGGWGASKLLNRGGGGGGGTPTTAETLAGTWKGEYECAQGVTGMTLVLDPGDDGRLDAVFRFYPIAENPAVPAGAIRMSGTYDDDSFTLDPGEWIDRPAGYQSVGAEAELDPADPERITGDVRNPACTTFEISKVNGDRSTS